MEQVQLAYHVEGREDAVVRVCKEISMTINSIEMSLCLEERRKERIMRKRLSLGRMVER